MAFPACLGLRKVGRASGEASPGTLGKQVRCCGDRCPSSFRGIRGSEGQQQSGGRRCLGGGELVVIS